MFCIRDMFFKFLIFKNIYSRTNLVFPFLLLEFKRDFCVLNPIYNMLQVVSVNLNCFQFNMTYYLHMDVRVLDGRNESEGGARET